MKTNHRIAFPIIAAALLAGCSASPQETFDRASKAFAAHQYSVAQKELVEALKGDPANPAVLDMMARTYLELEDSISAQRTLDRLQETGKPPADIALLRAHVSMIDRKFDAALSQIDGHTSAEAYRLRALAWIGKQDIAKAADAFAAGEKASGPKSRLLADYSKFMGQSHDLAAAQRLASAAIKAQPVAITAYLANADLALVRGDTGAALKLYDDALKVFPESRAAELGKIAALGDAARFDDAKAMIDAGLKVRPGDADLIFFKARMSAKEGNWAEVRKLLQPLEDSFAKRPRAETLYAQAMLNLKQPAQAASRLSSLLVTAPNNREVRRLLGEAWLASGDADGALKTLRPLAVYPDITIAEASALAKAAKQAGAPDAAELAKRAEFPEPSAIAAEFARGDAAIRAGNWLAAVTAYERIGKATSGKNVIALNNLAYAYGQMGNNAKALDHAETALKLAPDNPSVMDTAGWLLFSSGKDKDRALTLLRKAAQLAPDNASIRIHLTEAERG